MHLSIKQKDMHWDLIINFPIKLSDRMRILPRSARVRPGSSRLKKLIGDFRWRQTHTLRLPGSSAGRLKFPLLSAIILEADQLFADSKKIHWGRAVMMGASSAEIS